MSSTDINNQFANAFANVDTEENLRNIVNAQFANDGRNNVDAMIALASNGRRMIGIDDDQRQNLETLASVSAQAASLPNDEVQDVLDSCILETTKIKHINQAILYFKFAFDCFCSVDKKHLNEDFFKPIIINRLQEAVRKDASITNPKKKSRRPYFRQLLKKALDMSNNEHPFPVDMSKFSSKNFIAYLTTCKTSKGTLLSSDGYATKKSCIFHLYRLSETPQPPEVKQIIGQCVAGLKRQKAREDQATGQRIQVGKDSLKKDVYEYICELLLGSTDKAAIFAHCFLTLQWNLIGRSESVTNSHVAHLEWEDDCLIIYFAHTKCDQTGLKRDEPWHLYANPLKPSICPILALSRYIFSNKEILDLSTGGKLFPGAKQYSRYTKFMNRFFQTNKSKFLSKNMNVNDLGSHSARKGAATFACCGCTAPPPFVAVCLRACWSLGVKDRYFRHDSAGDHYLGRTLSGLPILHKEFAISPPYFDVLNSNLLSEELESKLNLLCGEGRTKLRLVTKFLLASICFHWDYLRNMLDERNILWSNAILNSVSDNLKAASICRYEWERTPGMPQLTGIPPHVLIFIEFHKLQMNYEKIITEVQKNPSKTVDLIKEHLDSRANSNLGINLQAMLDEKFSSLADEIKRSRNTPAREIESNQDHQEEEIKWTLFSWEDGSSHVLPEGFKFPNTKLSEMIELWLLGNKDLNISPLYAMSSKDFGRFGRTQRNRFNEFKYLMLEVEAIGRVKNCWKREDEKWNLPLVVKLQDSVREAFMFGHNRSVDRTMQHTWRTVYKKVRAQKQSETSLSL